MISIVDIQPQHLAKMYLWELDESLQWKVGVEKARTYDQFVSSYETYFRGESPRLLLQGVEVQGNLVGRVELYMAPEQAFLGIVMGERRGQGIGTQAVRLFLQKVKMEKHVHRVRAEVYEDNVDSLRFFKQNGFMLTGEVQEELYRGIPRKLIVLEKDT